MLKSEVRCSVEKLSIIISKEFLEIGVSGDYFGFDELLKTTTKQGYWTCETYDWEYREITEGVVQVIFKAYIKSTA